MTLDRYSASKKINIYQTILTLKQLNQRCLSASSISNSASRLPYKTNTHRKLYCHVNYNAINLKLRVLCRLLSKLNQTVENIIEHNRSRPKLISIMKTVHIGSPVVRIHFSPKQTINIYFTVSSTKPDVCPGVALRILCKLALTTYSLLYF